MYRIDRARLDNAAFAATETIPVRFDDLDTQGHVNNAAAVVLLQEVRADFNRRLGLAGKLRGLRTMVAAIHVEFADEIHYPGDVEVDTGVLALGRTSFTLAQVARQDGRACLYSEVTLVTVDTAGPTPLPDILRDGYGKWLIA